MMEEDDSSLVEIPTTETKSLSIRSGEYIGMVFDGEETCEIIYVDKIHGAPAAASIGQTVLELLLPDGTRWKVLSAEILNDLLYKTRRFFDRELVISEPSSSQTPLQRDDVVCIPPEQRLNTSFDLDKDHRFYIAIAQHTSSLKSYEGRYVKKLILSGSNGKPIRNDGPIIQHAFSSTAALQATLESHSHLEARLLVLGGPCKEHHSSSSTDGVNNNNKHYFRAPFPTRSEHGFPIPPHAQQGGKWYRQQYAGSRTVQDSLVLGFFGGPLSGMHNYSSSLSDTRYVYVEPSGRMVDVQGKTIVAVSRTKLLEPVHTPPEKFLTPSLLSMVK